MFVLYNCFQVISLEGWVDIMYMVQDAHSFWNWVYFVSLIVVSNQPNYYHSLLTATLTVFVCVLYFIQVISLAGWVNIMYYVQDAHSFWDWIYFVSLIVVSWWLPLPVIGDRPPGGAAAAVCSVDAAVDSHHLFCGPVSSTVNLCSQYSTVNILLGGATAIKYCVFCHQPFHTT